MSQPSGTMRLGFLVRVRARPSGTMRVGVLCTCGLVKVRCLREDDLFLGRACLQQDDPFLGRGLLGLGLLLSGFGLGGGAGRGRGCGLLGHRRRRCSPLVLLSPAFAFASESPCLASHHDDEEKHEEDNGGKKGHGGFVMKVIGKGLILPPHFKKRLFFSK